jgi:hypothetical protein
MGKCKECKNWNKWDNSEWGGCSILNDRKIIYPEIEDCMDVDEKTNDFYNNSNADFGCIKFKKK